MERGQKLANIQVNHTTTDHCQSHTVSDKKQQFKFMNFHFLIIEKMSSLGTVKWHFLETVHFLSTSTFWVLQKRTGPKNLMVMVPIDYCFNSDYFDIISSIRK